MKFLPLIYRKAAQIFVLVLSELGATIETPSDYSRFVQVFISKILLDVVFSSVHVQEMHVWLGSRDKEKLLKIVPSETRDHVIDKENHLLS